MTLTWICVRLITRAMSAVDCSSAKRSHNTSNSRGERMRRVVVADEPTGDLDAETTRQILELLRRLNSELGMTLLMVTHDPHAASIASRQFHLEQGQLILQPAAPLVGSRT